MLSDKNAKNLAMDILKRKIPIKKYAKSQFKTLYKHIATDIKKIIANNNTIPQNIAENYKTDIVSILRTAYRNTAEVFGNDIRKQINNDNKIEKSKIDIPTNESAKIDVDVMLFINNKSEQKASYITDTLQKKIDFYSSKAKESYNNYTAILQNSLTQLKNQMLQTANFKKKEELNKRIKTIESQLQDYYDNKNSKVANTFDNEFQDKVVDYLSEMDAENEVDYAENSVRDIESSGLLATSFVISGGAFAGYKINQVLYKQWNSALDSKTRTGHAMAYGQTVLASQNFAVANLDGVVEYGMHPKADTFSVGNSVNCRCTAIYFLKLPT